MVGADLNVNCSRNLTLSNLGWFASCGLG